MEKQLPSNGCGRSKSMEDRRRRFCPKRSSPLGAWTLPNMIADWCEFLTTNGQQLRLQGNEFPAGKMEPIPDRERRAPEHLRQSDNLVANPNELASSSSWFCRRIRKNSGLFLRSPEVLRLRLR